MKKVLMLAIFLSGFSAIGLEVLWTRVMIMIIGGSVYAFTIVLVAFLVGIAVGSLLASPFIGRLRNALLWFAVIEVLIGITVIVSIPLFGNLPFWFLDIYQSFGKSFGGLQFGLWILTGGVMFVPTLLMGAAFPIVFRAISRMKTNEKLILANERNEVGTSVGMLYAANTFGGVLGALAAGFLLIPMIGVQKGILGMGIVYLMVGVFVYANAMRIGIVRMHANKNIRINSDNFHSHLISILVLLVAVGSILLGFNFSAWEEDLLSSGFYKDPTLYIRQTKEELTRQLKRNKILYSKEGISAHVAVTQGLDGILSLKINGKADASTGSDMENQLLLAHLPMLLHPSSDGLKEVLVVGLGSGITLGSILSHNPKHVDAIEIEEKVVEAARYFNKYSNNALKDSRVKLIIADGRNYLQTLNTQNGTRKTRKYDVITSELSNPWLSGSSKLFTKEYFELLRKGIKEDGVVLHWINFYAIDIEGFKRVLVAFKQVFPEMLVFGMPASNDLALVGSNHRLMFDFERLEDSLKDKQIKSDLAKVGIENPFELLAYFVLDSQGVKKVVGNTAPNSDNYPYVEFVAPKYLYQPVSINPWKVIYDNLSPINVMLVNQPADKDSALISQQSALISASDEFRRSRLLTQIYSIEKNIGEGIKEGEKALKIDPDNIFIKEKLAQFYFEEGTSFFNQSAYSKAISSLSKSLALKKTPEALFNLGQTYGWDGDLEKARENYEKAVSLDPEFEQAWMWLGDTSAQLGDLNKAISSYQKAVRINPKKVEAHVSLGQLYILRRDFGKAEEHLDRALKLDPESKEARELLEKIP